MTTIMSLLYGADISRSRNMSGMCAARIVGSAQVFFRIIHTLHRLWAFCCCCYCCSSYLTTNNDNSPCILKSCLLTHAKHATICAMGNVLRKNILICAICAICELLVCVCVSEFVWLSVCGVRVLQELCIICACLSERVQSKIAKVDSTVHSTIPFILSHMQMSNVKQ